MSPEVRSRRAALVDAAFRTLPGRYLGAEPGFRATYRIKLADIGTTWEVSADRRGAWVRPGAGHRRPDVVITTDAVTWLRLHRSDISGVKAFSERRLVARGNLDLAMGFEGLFRRLDGRPPFGRVHDVSVGRLRISTLTMGSGRDVVLLHGLGATKASFVDTAAALSEHYRVHALDLPGFGSSSKPATAPYTPRWFAARVLDWMDEMGIDRAHLVGNSMGGHISIEIGLDQPGRVGALGLLCPAVAFVRRELWPMVRLARPELGVLPHRWHRSIVAGQFWDMVADRDRVDPAIGDIAVDEFRRIYDSANARYAFLSAARNIYLTPPFGRRGFYPRLAQLKVPALFLWGSQDPLVPSAFSRQVAAWLPRAEQIVLENCGHVPQIERPEQVNGLLRRFFAHADALTDRPALAVGEHAA